MACREGRLSVTGRVLVTVTELGPPGLGAAPEKDGANHHQRSVKTDEKKRARAVLPKLCLVICSVPFQALPGWFRIGFGGFNGLLCSRAQAALHQQVWGTPVIIPQCANSLVLHSSCHEEGCLHLSLHL